MTGKLWSSSPVLGALFVLAVLFGAAGSAAAFDFFGLFGSDAPPAPSPGSLPYTVAFAITGDGSVQPALEQSSNFFKLRQTAPGDGFALVQRLKADFAPMVDALWGAGYYNASLNAVAGGTRFALDQTEDSGVLGVVNAYRNRAPVPVTIVVETGPLFTLRNITVADASSGRPFPPDMLPPNVLKLKPGDPARASGLRDANERLIDYFRSQSHPLVKAPLPAPIVDHTSLTMDVTFLADPGPYAGFGEVTLTGPQGFDPAILRSYIYIKPGQPYSPKALADTRRSIGAIKAVGAVRIREGGKLDANGNLPIFIDVGGRPRNLIGFAAEYSTVDGPTGNVYYENRNLFGGAETLRLTGSVFYAPPVYGIETNSYNSFKGPQNFESAGLGGRLAASFVKPAPGGSRADLLIDGIAEESRSGGGSFGGYVDQFAGGTAALRYRFTGTLDVQAGLKYEQGGTIDALGRIDYKLLGVPLTLHYDGTDNLLNPARGVRLAAYVTPYPDVLGSASFTKSSITASTYYALDEDARCVLAGRGGFGSIFAEKGGLASIPADYRFYEGGLTTVRGYQYQTIGPSTSQGYTIGGLSGASASVEARIRVIDNIGVAPFFDIGGAYRGSLPFSRGDTRMASGLGLLYYTPIGPIRLDLARPLDPRPGDRAVVFYVSIGQPF